MKRREFILFPLLSFLGCIEKEKIIPMRASRLLNSFASAPPASPYSSEYQLVLSKSLDMGNVWTSTTQSASPTAITMDGVESIQFGNFVYLLGGWNEDSSPLARKSVYRASVTDLTTWTQLSDAPWTNRHTFGSGILSGKLFIWGSDAISVAQDCWSATQDVNGVLTWTKESDIPCSARALAGTTVHNGYLYILGGEDSTSTLNAPPTDVWRSPDGVNWTKIGDGVADFGGNMAGALCSFNGNLYTIGGGRYFYSSAGTRTYLNKIYKSTDHGANWTLLTVTAPDTTQYAKTVVFDNKLWSLMGYPNSTNPFYLDTNDNLTVPTIVNKFWTGNIHAVSACVVNQNGTDLLFVSHGSYIQAGNDTTNYCLTIAKSTSAITEPTDTQKSYQNTLMGLIKSNNWYSGATALKCFYVFNYGSSEFATINWVSPWYYKLTRNNSPTWTDGAGFAGNASNMWLQPSGLDPTTLSDISQDNCSIFAWVNNNYAAATSRAIFGSSDASAGLTMFCSPRWTSTTTRSRMFDTNGQDTSITQTSGAKELWHMTRTSSTGWDVYRGRVKIGTATGTSSAAYFAKRLSILSGVTVSNTIFYPSDAQLSCFGFGPAIDNTALNDMWDSYRTLTGL